MTEVRLRYRMTADTPFEQAVQAIVEAIYSAQEERPGVPRYLRLDIEGHRKPDGGFDRDAWELIQLVFNHFASFLSGFDLPHPGPLRERMKVETGNQNNVPRSRMIVEDPDKKAKEVIDLGTGLGAFTPGISSLREGVVTELTLECAVPVDTERALVAMLLSSKRRK